MMWFFQCCVYSLDSMIYFRDKSNNEQLRRILSIVLIPVGLIRYIFVSLREGMLSRNINKDNPKCAVVLIMKNEARYIREFIEYYSLLGCDVIIYDNDSDSI